MMRPAAAVLLAVVGALPLAVLPSRPITWLVAAALVVGGAGVVVLSVPLVTVGASLALIAYTLALVIVGPAVDPVAAIAFGVTLVLLLALVHFAGRVDGAAISPAVITAQIRHWLVIVAAGVVAAVVLLVAGAALGATLLGAALPVVVVVAALGAVLTMVGVITLVSPGARSQSRSTGS
jgi:hypothetical protein